jgi:hypothetical protein
LSSPRGNSPFVLLYFDIILVEEFDQHLLVGLQKHLGQQGAIPELLDDLQQINLTSQLFLCLFKKQVVSFRFASAATAPRRFERVVNPKPGIFITKDGAQTKSFYQVVSIAIQNSFFQIFFAFRYVSPLLIFFVSCVQLLDHTVADAESLNSRN